MERLEAVVEQMENSKLPLEELIRCYEEGTQLIKVCSERLSAPNSASRSSPAMPPASRASRNTPRPRLRSRRRRPPKSSKETKSVPTEAGPAAGRSPAKQENEVSLF